MTKVTSEGMPPFAARRSASVDPGAARAVHRAVADLLVSQSDVEVHSQHLRTAAAALALAQAADRLARAEIVLARDEDGATWEDVGEALGISRQAAHERFRTGPDGMHSRLFAKKAAQASTRTSGSGTSGSGSSKVARKASRTRS